MIINKRFFRFDSENPETTFYPDLSIINDSEYIRYIYNLKLNDMTINKKLTVKDESFFEINQKNYL